MKQTIAVAILSLIVFASCEDDVDTSAPRCIVDEIERIENADICDDPYVESYLFEGEIVYLISEGSCIADGATEVVDQNCDNVGYLGGLTGNTEVNGKNWEDHAEFIKLIWKK